jgi:hypothetical protein
MILRREHEFPAIEAGKLDTGSRIHDTGYQIQDTGLN